MLKIKKLDLMLIKGFIPPFMLSFLMALFVLVMQVFWLYIDDILGKGAGILVILEFLFYLSFSLTPMALPIGVLLAGVFLFVTMEGLFKKIESGSMKDVRVVLKTDVKGSLEVLKEALPGLSTEEVKLRILHCSVGGVTESDILLADASDAIVIGFHVETEDRAAELARVRGVEIKNYTVIYQVIEEMQAALEGLLEPELVEQKQGHAAVKEVFRISRVGAIAGCMMIDGKFERQSQVRIIRDGKVVHTGKVESLKRFKDDVKEVAEGYECGIRLVKHDDIRKNDVLEAFIVQKVARKLERKK